MILNYIPRVSTLFPYTTLFRSCGPSRTTTAWTAGTSVRSRTHRAPGRSRAPVREPPGRVGRPPAGAPRAGGAARSEEHTSELQSRGHLVCRLLLEKKKQKINSD